MVNRLAPTQRTRDRAQLLLIAAIALAFIILGIVVVFNSVLYTQTMSSSTSIETTADAQTAEIEMARGVRGIAQEVNLESSHSDFGDVNDTLEVNSRAFTGQYQNATAERRPAIVNLSVVGVGTKATAASSSNTGGEVFNSSNRSYSEIGHFALRLDETFGGEVTVRANESSNENTITIDGDGSGGFDITDLDGLCSITPEEGTIIFDFTTGEIIGSEDNCEIKLINRNGSYESLSFEDDAEGDYELVARGEDDLVENGNEGGWSAAWSVDLEYTYDTSELTVDRQFEVDVYGDRR